MNRYLRSAAGLLLVGLISNSSIVLAAAGAKGGALSTEDVKKLFKQLDIGQEKVQPVKKPVAND